MQYLQRPQIGHSAPRQNAASHDKKSAEELIAMVLVFTLESACLEQSSNSLSHKQLLRFHCSSRTFIYGFWQVLHVTQDALPPAWSQRLLAVSSPAMHTLFFDVHHQHFPGFDDLALSILPYQGCLLAATSGSPHCLIVMLLGLCSAVAMLISKAETRPSTAAMDDADLPCLSHLPQLDEHPGRRGAKCKS